MTGCCVTGCNNRTEKGFRVFCTPTGERNKARRDEWIRLIGRDTLPKKAYVCEVHFDSEQFESQRIDGRKLLRQNAKPNLLEKHTLENAEQLDLPEATKPENAEQLDLPEATKPENAEQLDLPEATIHSNEVENIESYKDVEITAYTTASNVKESQHCTNTARITASNCKTYDEKYVTKLRKTLKKMVQRNKIMKRKLREKDARLKKIFNDDQYWFLAHNTQRGVGSWSSNTINKALKLYMAGGQKAYDEI
ncbi:PREDICTED: uncharacterized protein LOC105566351, partial [Vollenhovia emeryi]|uniref:uncharacterized protein LOC105566351 n=1 Tax=Vollenhovia emeryi TaxID=411798 RepID=UPI0005F4AE19